ncbi:16S rRNA (guanine(527)-N(7))-methyltransferase RsmG [Sphingomonas sp. A2-49]|uniref:16S rRNA (guanine(527)-N(7))-methyltransferase RsmG n=1 Tax=Sphingomonas sp. A2-49 TaxID=1391375 RepID=UPI0021D29DFD|nr:16S rRNA (guanine(527)-N(7))-methyltransferase RsmG [Sphingomonas sp. A2-49]MCU6454214.1 16S rRNA (guanine(527)-N(7))-methyltransferase RsmG [Sphingomonas sp. A2-49]
MTEDDARAIVTERFGSARTDRLAAFLELVADENGRQNLVSPSTLPTIWVRHGLDSAQLLFHVKHSGPWLDIGTGGGFPGLVIGLLGDAPVTLVEPRKKRATFLEQCVDRFGLGHVVVEARKVESVTGSFATISARAVASVEKLLPAAEHCATPATRWILPRGQLDDTYLAVLRRDRSRVFHVEQSLTDPQSSILIVDRKTGTGR